MEIFETLQSFFNRVSWPFHHIEGETALHLEYEGDNGAWSCYAIAAKRSDSASFIRYVRLWLPMTKWRWPSF
jgi:hypothetical protein